MIWILMGESRPRSRPVWLLLALGTLLASSAPAQNDDWARRESMPTPRRLLAAAEHGGLIYTFGGCGSPCFDPTLHPSTFEETRVEVYDPATNTWSTRDAMPTIFFSGAAATVGQFIYVAGGAQTGNVLQRYDPATDAWTLMAAMPTSRRGLALVAAGGMLYALGGSGPSSAFERYDPGSNTWSALAPLPTPRVFLAAAVVGNEIFAIGGSPDCCGDSQTGVVEVYDIAAGAWRTVAPLPVAQQVQAATRLGDRVYVFGGFVPGGGARDSVFEYDPATDSWAGKTPMPTARDQAPAVLLGDSVYVVGGSVDCHCQALGANERYMLVGAPEPQADLEVTKTDDVAVVCPGAEVTYRISVTNRGPDAASGATVTDAFSPLLTDITWECEGLGGASCGAASGTGAIDETVDLPNGAEVRYTASGTVACGAADELANVAVAEVPEGVVDPVPENNTAFDVDGISLPLLLVSKSSDMGAVAAGGTLTYTMVVENDGVCDVEATVTDVFSPQLDGVSWTCAATAGAVCTAAGAGDLADPIFLPAAGKVTYTAIAAVACDPSGVLVNTVTVEPGCGGAPASATVTVPVLSPTADLEITKTKGFEEALLCEEVTYTLEASNLGSTCPVIGATIRDDFPPQLVDVEWMCTPCAPGTGLGDLACLADLDPGESVTCSATGFVAVGATGVLSNVATIDPPDGTVDPILANNRASAAGDAIRKRTADLSVIKDCDPDSALAGDELTCTITVSNAGPDEVFAAPVSDDFPAGLLEEATWTCAAAGGASCTPTGEGDVFDAVDLPAGAAVTYVAIGTVSPLASGEICNTVTVDPPGEPGCFEDPDLGNNSDTFCVTVLADCNDNGVDDAIDIAIGTSADVDGNGEPDECQIGEADWVFHGTAEGGTVVVTVAGVEGLFGDCVVVTTTVAGESAETVAANNASDLATDACLAAQDFGAKAMGATVWVHGFLLDQERVSLEITDPGLDVGIPVVKIPGLSPAGLGLLALLLAAAGIRLSIGRCDRGQQDYR